MNGKIERAVKSLHEAVINRLMLDQPGCFSSVEARAASEHKIGEESRNLLFHCTCCRRKFTVNDRVTTTITLALLASSSLSLDWVWSQIRTDNEGRLSAFEELIRSK